jgi:hypothetical protein
MVMTDVVQRGREAAARMEGLSAPILDQLPVEHRPVLIAMLERGAAKRYRQWAEGAADASERDGLLACAAREEAIAAAAEALVPNPAEILATFTVHLPALRDAFTEVYGNKSRLEQLAVQAAGERVGAAIWRRFAASAGPEAKATFLHCAELEEGSADFLDDLLRSRV